ncbi:MAG: hypothetical protein J5J06_12330 [Phycisphaerae bacterium]|nr:hypothetical protein [Phycisphaerae bacterium]
MVARILHDVQIEWAIVLGIAVCAPVIILGWIRIWARHIIWSRRRISRTLLILLLSIFAGATLGTLVAVISHLRWRYGGIDDGVVIGGLTLLAAWLMGTGLTWCETPEERHSRLRSVTLGKLPCLNCGYDLTGLHEARCPECGTHYTLNELVADALDRRADLPG